MVSLTSLNYYDFGPAWLVFQNSSMNDKTRS